MEPLACLFAVLPKATRNTTHTTLSQPTTALQTTCGGGACRRLRRFLPLPTQCKSLIALPATPALPPKI